MATVRIHNNSDEEVRKGCRLVLVGAGHAHVQVVRLLAASKIPSGFVSITLVDVQKFSNYCGMISGYLSRQYQDYQETVIDLKELCCHPDCTFVNDGVIDIDFDQKLIYLTEDSKRIPYDVLSLDIGSATKSLDDVPGAFEFTIPTRPIHDLVSRLERIETDFSKKHQDRQKEVRLVVVGGGASGVELAMSLVGRWRPLLKDRLHITLVTADGSIMSGDNRGGHRTLKEILLKKGIYICFHANVVEVEKNFLKLKSGMKVLFSYCVWATGAGCHDLARTLQHRGLAVTPDGWIDVNESLQSISHPNVFAAGDCCHSSSLALPKAGIYSIQEGPVLARNLRLFNTPRRVAARSLEHFYPDTHGGLQFLDCGDGTALGFAFGMVLQGRWVHDIKMAMDREFITLFSGQPRPSWDNTNLAIDDEVFNEIGSMISTSEAADMLQQIDVVNYRQAWWLLKYMTHHEDYRIQVLRKCFAKNQHYSDFDRASHQEKDNGPTSKGGNDKPSNGSALPRSSPQCT